MRSSTILCAPHSHAQRSGFCRFRRWRWRDDWLCNFCPPRAQQGTRMAPSQQDRERATVASVEELASLLYHPSADVLLALLDNPALDEARLCLLLERKDLPAEVLEEIGRRKPLLKNYRVKRALAFHPRTPRLVSLRFLREL